MSAGAWTEAELGCLLDAFLARALPAEAWTHEAHLLVGLMLARRLPEPELLPRLRETISAHNLAAGTPNTDTSGYHETITAFYAASLAAYARASAALSLPEAAARLLTGPLADRQAPLRAYRPETLKSVRARRDHVAPELEGFDAEELAAEAFAAGAALSIRPATAADVPALRALMDAAIGELLPAFLPPETVAASREVMGLDTQLIADGTYHVVLQAGLIVGCGGWSRRATLFGGDHSSGRDAALLDPAREPARVRAMYTRPGWTRRGIGRLVLALCEADAAAEGFTACELAATLGGEPLYRAAGYGLVERFEAPTRAGPAVPLLKMRKSLTPLALGAAKPDCAG